MRKLFGPAVFMLCLVLLCGDSSVAKGKKQSYSSTQKKLFKVKDKVMPSVVLIMPIKTTLSGGKKQQYLVIGSGVIFNKEGYVLTNYHVAGRAKKAYCRLYNKQKVSATVIGGDPWTDLAVIKLNLEEVKGKITWTPLGDSDSLQAGQFVMAMGSPFNLSRTLTYGVVCCPDQYLMDPTPLPTGEMTGNFNRWVQTDALINPGNSGGPLVDLDGKVVGINTRGGAALGYAVPVNIAKRVAKEIIEKGYVSRSYIGVQSQPIESLSKYLREDYTRGALVSSVDQDSPAFEAGIRAGDVILKYDGKDLNVRFIEDMPEFYRIIADTPVGKDVEITYLRDGKETTTKLKTEKLSWSSLGDEFECKEWGLAVQEITPEMRRDMHLRDSKGVLVIGVYMSGFAKDAKIVVGDIIKGLGDKDIDDFDQFKKAYKELVAAKKEKILVRTERNRALFLTVMKPAYKKDEK